jgi:hypothetical protein
MGRAPYSVSLAAVSTPIPGTQSRWRSRPSAAPLTKAGMSLFAVGLIAIFVDLALFASGRENLPVWLNLICMLAPVGLGVGLIGVVNEAKSARTGSDAADESTPTRPTRAERPVAAQTTRPEHPEEWNQPT